MSDSATVLVGLDGKVYLDDQGLTFERTKFRTAGRGVPTIHAVQWSAVRSAAVESSCLRVDVAGFDRPRLSSADPNAVDLKRGQREAAEIFAAQINARAAGPVASPAFETAVAPVAPPVEAAAAPASPGVGWSERIENFAMLVSGVGLVAFALASLVLLVVAVVIAVVLLV